MYGIPHNSLKDYHTTPNKKKYNINNLPSEEFRLHDEEIKSAIDFERETMQKGSSTSTEDTEDIFKLTSRNRDDSPESSITSSNISSDDHNVFNSLFYLTYRIFEHLYL